MVTVNITSPYALQCLGIARSTGYRCGIKWDLINGYCVHHQHQGMQARRQCIATASTTGQRCRITWGIDVDGYCSLHQRTDSAFPRCQGVYLNTNTPCTKPAKPRYGYCCAAHNPYVWYFSPRNFDSEVLTRNNLEYQVVMLCNGRDLYHADPLDMVTPGRVELDHILEKQCFSYAFHFLDFPDGDEDREFVAGIVRDDVVNELTNLCFTRTTTNRIKGTSTFKFLDDSITGHVGYRGSGSTFNDYMMAEYRDGM